MDYFILIITGIAAGTLGSIVGLGGAMIILPVLNLFFHFDPTLAIGTSLFAIIFTSLSSVLGHLRARHINVQVALKIGLSGISGVFIGSYIFSQYLADSLQVLRTCMALWFFFLSFRMGQQVVQTYLSERGKIKKGQESKPTFSIDAAGPLILLGLFVGVLAGILGIGGGIIMVPSLIVGFGLSPHLAVGTTFLAMLPMALSGGLIKLSQGYVVLSAGVLLGIGSATGAQLGVFFSQWITPFMMKAIFCVLFLIVGITYLI